MSGPRSTILRTEGGHRITLERSRLLVEAGPDEGLELVLLDRPVVVGNGPDADLRLGDPTIRSQHLIVQPGPRGWRVVDPTGEGDCRLDGVEIEAALFRPGARLALGATELVLRTGAVEIATAAEPTPEFEGLFGASPVMAALFGLVRRVAELDVPVLLQGESGTGKEGLARAIHRLGPRAAGPYEVVDCTLLEREHLRSELFGHVKGAFTGAAGARRGAFERADKGTLLLDEIGELPLDMQSALLRVLQEGEVRPLGGEVAVRVRTRVVAATHRDLEGMVAAGRFRQDLYYRLAALVVEVPPLRARGDDILALARRFLPRGVALAPDAEAALKAHRWPGNVRELEHAVRRAAAMLEGRTLAAGDLRLGSGPPAPAASSSVSLEPGQGSALGTGTLAAAEAHQIAAVLEACKGNRSQAAARLGIARSTLYLKIKELGLDKRRRG